MKNKINVLIAGIAAALVSTNAASAVLIGSGTVSGAGGATVSVPVTVVRAAADVANFAAATFTLSYAQAQLTGNPTFTPAGAAPWPGAAGINCTFAAGAANCSFATSGPFSNPVVAAGSYTLGTINYTLIAAPTFPIAITSVLAECTDQTGTKLTIPPAANPQCAPQNGSITAGPVGTAPTATVAGTATLTAGAGTVAVTVATVGTGGGSLALACTIPATGASAFAITAGANRTITAAAPVGANAPAIGLSCVPQAAAVNATLSCAQTPTPAAALPALTSAVTCPPVGPPATAITYQLPPGTAAAPAGITFPAGAGGAIGTTITAGFNVTGTNFVAPQTGTVGACTFAADPTPTAPAVSDPTAFTGFAQLTFNAANNTVAQPFNGTCTRRATAVSTIMSCPETQPSNAVNPVARVYRVTCPLGTVPPTAVTATLASGPLVVPAFTVGAGSSTTNLTFTGTAGGSVACAFNPAVPGYTATPNPLNLVGTTPGTVAVTFTGATAGTFTGNLVCNVAAPGTGGPFTYAVTTTVNGVVVPQIQVPALGNISLMLLIAGFLGLGAMLVGRRQA